MADKSGDSLSSSHAQLKIPAGDSPYVKAKHVQLVEKDPSRAVALFWSAINSADRVDSALKDMAVVLKQLNRAEEAIEAIKSFRGLCSVKSQEPLDNVLLDLYKKCGRVEEQIDLLNHKLRMIDEGMAFGGRITKTARSQGKKFHVTIEQEKSRLLGNLAWAYMQCENYKEAEPLYRKALEIEKDNNKMCNLAICLMLTGKHEEAKAILVGVEKPTNEFNEESYQKSFERAWEIMDEIELKPRQKAGRRSSSSSIISVSSPTSTCNEKTGKTPLMFVTPLPNDMHYDSSENGNHEASPDIHSPVSVKVTSQSKPMVISECSVERKKTDLGTENIVIRVEIQMNRQKRKQFVVSSKKVGALNSKNQIFVCSKASTGGNSGTEISPGSLEMSSSGPKVEPLSSKTTKMTWADMVEEDEQLDRENSGTIDSSETESFKFGSHGWNLQSAGTTPNHSWKKYHNNGIQGLKTGYQKYRTRDYKEVAGRWREEAKNGEGERRSRSFDRWAGCNSGREKLKPAIMESGGKSCEDSDSLNGVGGRELFMKQQNRLQVFEEITQTDEEVRTN